MSELKDNAFIIDSIKQLRIRVDGYLRGLGIYQIIGTKEYLEIIFVGGEFSVKVGYPNRLDKLFDTLKKRLLEETEFNIKEISCISYFIKEYIDEIESFLRK
ncbi:MAG: hypothetical protein DA329_05335 [Candidatus Nitrosocosmicus sp.]|jgi:hypothetical protein|nr:hypothetical protein [Candidatus Nitrosocosmicus sp.]